MFKRKPATSTSFGSNVKLEMRSRIEEKAQYSELMRESRISPHCIVYSHPDVAS
jgi:hypothetical protein